MTKQEILNHISDAIDTLAERCDEIDCYSFGVCGHRSPEDTLFASCGRGDWEHTLYVHAQLVQTMLSRAMNHEGMELADKLEIAQSWLMMQKMVLEANESAKTDGFSFTIEEEI